MPLRCEVRFKKGEKKFGFELGSIASKSTHFTTYSTGTDDWRVYFVVLTTPITRWWAELVELVEYSICSETAYCNNLF